MGCDRNVNMSSWRIWENMDTYKENARRNTVCQVNMRNVGYERLIVSWNKEVTARTGSELNHSRSKLPTGK